MFGDKLKNAFNTVKASLSPVVDKAKQFGGELLKSGFVGVGGGPLPSQFSPNLYRGLQKTATVADTALKKNIEERETIFALAPAQLKPVVTAVNKVNEAKAGFQTFALNTATDTLRSAALAGEGLSTPSNIKETLTSFAKKPQQLKEQGVLKTISDESDPSIALLMTLANIPTGGEGGIVGEAALKIVAKQAVKASERKLAEATLKEAVTNPNLWKTVMKNADWAIETILNTPLGSAARDFFAPGSFWIKQVDGGEEMLKRVIKTMDMADIEMNRIAKPFIPYMKELTDEEFAQVLDIQRGLPVKGATQKVNDAAKAFGKVMEDYGAWAKKLKIKVGAFNKRKDFIPLKNYVPQRLNKEVLKRSPELQDKLAGYLVNTGQIPDSVIKGKKQAGTAFAKAQKFVQSLMNDVPVRTAYSELFPNHTLPKRLGNLEMERVLELPTELDGVRILDSSKKLITDYMARASRRLAQVENFGVDNKVLDKFKKTTAGQDYAPEAVKLIKRYFGNEPITLRQINSEKASSFLRSWQALTKMGTSVIGNTTQSINTATSYGTGNTISAVFKILGKDKKAMDFAYDAGIAAETAIRDLADAELGNASGFLSKLRGTLTAPGFKPVERFNRQVAATAGKEYALQQFQRLLANPSDAEAIRALEKFGVDVDKALKTGKLSETDLITSARRAVDTTQFQVSPLDLPPSWTSTWGRVLTQFKNFGYKQASFVAKEVMEPAFRGNFKPLIRYVIGSILLGEAAGDIKAVVRGRERPKDPWARVVDNMKQTGGIGLVGDAVQSAKYYKGLTSWVVGPTVDDAIDILTDVGSAAQGNARPLLKFAVQSIPIIGPFAASRMPKETTGSTVTLPKRILPASRIAPTGTKRVRPVSPSRIF